jgi:hypothetical protein
MVNLLRYSLSRLTINVIEPPSRPRWWQTMLALDLRSLALFRIGLGLFTTGDILHRSADIRTLYRDGGAMPRSAVSGEFANPWHWSFHLVSDALWWQVALFAICALAGLAMAAGYRTRMATLICWLLSVSIQNRNEIALDGGDMVQRLLLFWSLFVPLGAVWSVDAIRLRGAAPTARSWIFSPGSAGLTIQMASIFFFAALLKTGDSWRKNFDAVWYALHWDVYATPIGIWLRQFPDLLRGLTIGTMILEGLFPLLLFIPSAPLRVFVLVSLMLFHVGFVVAMKLFMFAAIMILGWLALMPGWLWDRVGLPLVLNPKWSRRMEALSERLPGGQGWSPAGPWLRGTQVVALLCLLYIMGWNLRQVLPGLERAFPAELNPIASTLRIDQYWIMFAPNPVTSSGWIVAPGKLADGRVVDVFRGGAPLDWSRPAHVADTYINRRWRRYLWTITKREAEAYRKYFAGYLCREWDRHHDELLESVDIVFMQERANPDHTITRATQTMLWQGYRCH